MSIEGQQSVETSHRGTYHQIQEGVYFVPGVKRGSICDTRTGNVYSVNGAAKDIILGQGENPEFQATLQNMNLISSEPPRTVERRPSTFKLDFVWFEIISDDCNERCLHCYADSMPPTWRQRLGIVEAM